MTSPATPPARRPTLEGGEAPGIPSFKEFWPFYVSQHRRQFFVGRYDVRQGSSGEFKRANGAVARASLRHPEHGSFVLCVRRADNGAWQIAADMWNDSGQLGFLPAAH